MLFAAMCHQKTALAILSVLSGAQVNNTTDIGVSPIHCAVLIDNITMIINLWMMGANVNVKEEEYGLTPLDLAILRSNVKATRLLISLGAKTIHPMVLEVIGMAPHASEGDSHV